MSARSPRLIFRLKAEATGRKARVHGDVALISLATSARCDRTATISGCVLRRVHACDLASLFENPYGAPVALRMAHAIDRCARIHADRSLDRDGDSRRDR